MTETIENTKRIALIFFIVTGMAHLGSSAFIANKLFLKQAFIVNKTMDIPFIITGLIYGLASLRLNLSNPNKEHKVLDISLLCVIIVALIAVVIINLVIPDL